MGTRIDERRLAEFVDRDDELARFCALLDSTEKHIMVVWGESGIGKSSFLLRIVHECASRQLTKAEVVWKESTPHDYLAVMRKIRDDIGPEHFPAFTDLVNYYTQEGYRPQININLSLSAGGAIEVAGQARISGSDIGDIAGVIIKDSMFVLPRQDIQVPVHERRERLTRRFLEELNEAVSRSRRAPLIVMLDAVEKMASDTDHWLWEQMLDAIRQGRLTGVKFVLCGQKPPPDDRDWRLFLEEAGLKPLADKDILRYLEKRFDNFDAASDAWLSVAHMVLDQTGGNPAEVAKVVDRLKLQQEKRRRG